MGGYLSGLSWLGPRLDSLCLTRVHFHDILVSEYSSAAYYPSIHAVYGSSAPTVLARLVNQQGADRSLLSHTRIVALQQHTA